MAAKPLMEMGSKIYWGSLEGLASDYAKSVIAVCLENQRIVNESTNGDIRRWSIPLTRLIFDPKIFVLWDLVAIQAMLGPCGLAFFNKNAEEILAYSRSLRVRFPFPGNGIGLDCEAGLMALAMDISEEIGRDVIKDLRLNAGTLMATEWNDSPQDLWATIDKCFKNVTVKCGHHPNWMVVGPGMLKFLGGHRVIDKTEAGPESMGLRRIGTTDGNYIKIIEDKLFPPAEVLVGYKGGDYDAGYAFMPYVPLASRAVMLSDSFPATGPLMTRYGKKMAKNGSAFYGRLVVNNFPHMPKETTDGQGVESKKYSWLDMVKDTFGWLFCN